VTCKENNAQVILADSALEADGAVLLSHEASSDIHWPRLIFLAGEMRNGHIQQAIKRGAAGYVSKCEPFEVLRQAILSVCHGGTFYCARTRSRLDESIEGGSASVASESRLALLTRRQREVLVHVARGLATRQIADAMDVRPKTVDVHKAKILKKLGLHDRLEIARFAYREGLVRP
jgi:DNA-binding NarL/FixJ family response regulator